MKKYLIVLFIFTFLFSHILEAKEGDVIDGVPVISKLDTSILKAGKKYRFMFEGVETGIGQKNYVPIMVAKGKKDGKRLVLTAAIHGDEVNGIRVIQKLFEQINVSKLNGTIVGVIIANPNGTERITRKWESYYSSGFTTNLNRVFPGKENGNPAEKHAFLLWNNLLESNADIILDLHTQSTGTSFPFFIYADYRNDEAKAIAELFPADQIKKDLGEKGTLETTSMEAGIPSITLELGDPRIYDLDKINRSIEGIHNVMVHYKMIDEKMKRTAKDVNTYIGNTTANIRAKTGGFTSILVSIGKDVKKDDLVAVQRNAWGDIIEQYYAPIDGKVLSIGTDVVREPRSLLVRILGKLDSEECKDGC